MWVFFRNGGKKNYDRKRKERKWLLWRRGKEYYRIFRSHGCFSFYGNENIEFIFSFWIFSRKKTILWGNYFFEMSDEVFDLILFYSFLHLFHRSPYSFLSFQFKLATVCCPWYRCAHWPENPHSHLICTIDLSDFLLRVLYYYNRIHWTFIAQLKYRFGSITFFLNKTFERNSISLFWFVEFFSIQNTIL